MSDSAELCWCGQTRSAKSSSIRQMIHKVRVCFLAVNEKPQGFQAVIGYRQVESSCAILYPEKTAAQKRRGWQEIPTWPR
eukprot:g80436.t1